VTRAVTYQQPPISAYEPAQVRYTSRFRGIAGTVRKGVCLALLNSLAVLR
jgi:hypothetical protein